MSRRSANFAAFPVLTQDSQGPQEVTWANPRQLVKSSCIRRRSDNILACESVGFTHVGAAIPRVDSFGARGRCLRLFDGGRRGTLLQRRLGGFPFLQQL